MVDNFLVKFLLILKIEKSSLSSANLIVAVGEL